MILVTLCWSCTTSKWKFLRRCPSVLSILLDYSMMSNSKPNCRREWVNKMGNISFWTKIWRCKKKSKGLENRKKNWSLSWIKPNFRPKSCSTPWWNMQKAIKPFFLTSMGPNLKKTSWIELTNSRLYREVIQPTNWYRCRWFDQIKNRWPFEGIQPEIANTCKAITPQEGTEIWVWNS